MAQREPARHAVVVAPPALALGEAPDRRAGLRETERDALAGEGVDVAAGVADEQHPPGDPRPRHLPQRTRAHDPGAVAGEPVPQARDVVEHVLEAGAAPDEGGHPDQVVGDGGHVDLGPVRPVHLDEGRPRRLRDVAAQPEARGAGTGCVQADRPADGGVQAVRGDEVPGGLAVHDDVVGGLSHVLDRTSLDRDPSSGEPLGQGVVQHRAAYAPPWRAGEPCADAARGGGVEVADPGQHAAWRVHAQRRELGHRARHQALAARLVDRPGPRLAHDHVEPAPVGVERHRHPDRTAAGHDQVTHGRARPRAAGPRARRSRCGSGRRAGPR